METNEAVAIDIAEQAAQQAAIAETNDAAAYAHKDGQVKNAESLRAVIESGVCPYLGQLAAEHSPDVALRIAQMAERGQAAPPATAEQRQPEKSNVIVSSNLTADKPKLEHQIHIPVATTEDVPHITVSDTAYEQRLVWHRDQEDEVPTELVVPARANVEKKAPDLPKAASNTARKYDTLAPDVITQPAATVAPATAIIAPVLQSEELPTGAAETPVISNETANMPKVVAEEFTPEAAGAETMPAPATEVASIPVAEIQPTVITDYETDSVPAAEQPLLLEQPLSAPQQIIIKELLDSIEMTSPDETETAATFVEQPATMSVEVFEQKVAEIVESIPQVVEAASIEPVEIERIVNGCRQLLAEADMSIAPEVLRTFIVENGVQELQALLLAAYQMRDHAFHMEYSPSQPLQTTATLLSHRFARLLVSLLSRPALNVS